MQRHEGRGFVGVMAFFSKIEIPRCNLVSLSQTKLCDQQFYSLDESIYIYLHLFKCSFWESRYSIIRVDRTQEPYHKQYSTTCGGLRHKINNR